MSSVVVSFMVFTTAIAVCSFGIKIKLLANFINGNISKYAAQAYTAHTMYNTIFMSYAPSTVKLKQAQTHSVIHIHYFLLTSTHKFRYIYIYIIFLVVVLDNGLGKAITYMKSTRTTARVCNRTLLCRQFNTMILSIL